MRKFPKRSAIRRFLDKVPGKQTFGVYRFLPFFFILGASLEFSMIHWKVGETNFYNTYKKRQAKNILEQEYHEQHQLKVKIST